jgi:hypothetical protein
MIVFLLHSTRVFNIRKGFLRLAQCPKEKRHKGDDTMSKRKTTKGWRHNVQKKNDTRVTTQCSKEKRQKGDVFLLNIVSSPFCRFSFEHCVVTPVSFFFWTLCRHPFVVFLLDIVSSPFYRFSFGHCVVTLVSFFFWTLCHDKRVTTQCSKEKRHKGDDTMFKRKTTKRHNDLQNATQ